MIRSFRDLSLQAAWENARQSGPKLLPIAADVFRVLDSLHVATTPTDVAFLGRYFEWIEGDRNRYGISLTEHWTITFGWELGNALDVDLDWN